MERIPTILGPTASGKTSLAIKLARKINGEIIGLDSRQIYKDIPIGTAQPALNEILKTPHHLIGIKSLSETVSAGQYAKMVKDAISTIKERKKIPIICGGSGLYFSAVSKGIFKNSVTDKKIRDQLTRRYEKGDAQSMLNELSEIDPEYSKLVHVNNKKRLIRALEIIESTGKSPSLHFQDQKNNPQDLPDLYTIYLDWNKVDLKRRIKIRTSEMLANGWVDEVRNVLQKYPNKTLHPLDSIGFKEIISYLKDELLFEDLENIISIKTNQFARKQVKWFKKEKLDLIIPMLIDYPLTNAIDEIEKNIN